MNGNNLHKHDRSVYQPAPLLHLQVQLQGEMRQFFSAAGHIYK